MKRENKALIVIAVLSFLAGVIFRHDETYKLTIIRILIIAAGIVICNLCLYVKGVDKGYRRCMLLCSIMGLFTLALMQGISWFCLQQDLTNEWLIWSTAVLFLGLSVWCLWCAFVERDVTENMVTMMIFAGFLIRLFYVVMTDGRELQNDVGFFEEWSYGHLRYVYEIFATGRLPMVNPMEHDQFYHPPLHYMIASIFLRIYTMMGVESAQWDEVLQMLPLFYSTAILVFLNKIALQLRCQPLGRCVMLGLAAFIPYSIHMSGALNNDPLVTLLMVMCIYFTVKWYEEPNIKNILPMAACIGCAMMTKLSGALAAPAMAVVMLWKAWKDRTQWKEYIKQFVIFGMVAFPLGVWYPVLRWLQYRMPLGYVRSLPITFYQFIGMYAKRNRFQDYKHALESLSLRWGPAPDVDYNIPVSILKFSVFNEMDYYKTNPVTLVLGTAVFWGTAVMFILFVAAFVWWLFERRGRMIYKVFLGTICLVLGYAYVKFCLSYPHVCTMNVRYVMVAVYIGTLVLGIAVSGIHKKMADRAYAAGKIFGTVAMVFTVVYMLCSTLLNFQLERILYA